MIRCNHMFVSKGRYYERQPHSAGELFTVFQLKKCAHCDKTERKVELRRKVYEPEAYERQLRFSGVKPASLPN